MRRWPMVGLVVLGGCGGAVEPPTPAPEAAPVTGLYTAAQADRGEEVFTMVCSTCHGRNEFSGQMFRMTWMTRPIGDLFQHIRTAMPQDAPGSLNADQYASVVAYMLRLNGRPAGDRELPPDPAALADLRW